MAVPILTKRRERKQAQIDMAIEKAMTPMLAQAAAQSQAASGATYNVAPRGTPNPSAPFDQTGGYGGAFNPLPRGESNFNSLFGPGYPLIPDPLDQLGSDGRAMPRRTQYLVAANLQLIDRRLPWSVLKGLADDVDVVQRCIQIVQDAIVGLNWSWGFSPMILQQIMAETGVTNTAKASQLARDKYGEELQRVQEFFEYPDKRMGFTFSQWLTDIIYSHLVYDGIVIYPQYNLGGELMSLSTIDTSTIKILLDNQGFIPRPPAPAYQQILYGFPRGEFVAEEVDENGDPINGYRQDQLAYYIRRPHPSSIYGYSQVEECVNIATLYMQRQAWLHSEYTHGVTPRLLIETADTEIWTPEQTAYYEQIFNDRLSGQIQRRQQAFFLRPGMKPTEMKQMDEMYKATYDEWLITQIGSKFGIPATQLGVKAPASLGGGSTQKGQADASEQFATDALRNFLIDCINDMARRFLGVGPELTITCTGGGNEDDNVMRAQADASDVSAGIRSRNEIRAERGIPLVDEPEADQLGITTGQGVSFLAGQLAAQQASQGAQGTPAKPAPSTTSATPPAKNEGATDGNSNSDSGREPVPSGDGSSQGIAAASVAPSGPSSSSDKRLKVTAKDDARQPDIAAQKELAAFAKFAKARTQRGSWRNFSFHHLHPSDAERLNRVGESGDLALLKAALSAPLSTEPVAAGICVRAADTGRVLLRQRTLDHDNGAGTWEFPGGKIEPGETTAEAAVREWEEEVGRGLPDGEMVTDWTTPNGVYVTYLWEISDEAMVPGGDADEGGVIAWFEVADLPGNPALRDEMQQTPWHTLGMTSVKAAREFNQHKFAKQAGDPAALIDWYNAGADGAIDWGSEGDFDACVAIAGKYIDNPEGFCQLRHIDATGGPAGSEGKKSAADTYTPNQATQQAAQRALEWIKDGKAGGGFTDVGRKRASDLAAGHVLSFDTVKRMKAYFDRHQPDQKAEGFEAGEDGYPSPGRVAWDAWGGDAGYAWAKSIVDSASKSISYP